jgi:GMP synthase (glutamine-hydrolysing)
MSGVLVLRHVAREPLGTIETAFAQAAVEWSYVDLFGVVPQHLDLEKAAGLVVLGGPMNVNQTDAYPWLASEVGWIRHALGIGLPILGVCLGAQLLAKALDAKVFPSHVKEIGWYELELTADAEADPLFRGCERRQTVFQFHGDTFDLPEGAVHLARCRDCENQAFRYGDCAYGLQFHIEMTQELVEDWLGNPEERRAIAALGYIDPEAILAETPRALHRMAVLGERILPRFTAMCKRRETASY